MTQISMNQDKLVLEYSLLELPTAQHKAGLAGLLVMIESLRLRKMSPLPETAVTPTGATICLTKESLQLVFDDLYDAEYVEKQSKTKWQDQEPKAVKEVEIEFKGKKKKQKLYIYDAVQPKGSFLQTFYPDGDGIWMKLHRDMTWTILRGIPATRKVYEERAKGQPSSEGAQSWTNLAKACELRKQAKIQVEQITSSLLIGAEAENPEKVPFRGVIEDNLLLLFWPIVSLIFVPRELEIKRTEDRFRINDNNELGYVVAISEPSNLEAFIEDAIDVLRAMVPDVAGFRPREALIDIFQESGLECLYRFAKKKLDVGPFIFSLHAIEMYHLQKQGNRIRQLATDSMVLRPDLISDYEKVRGSLKNPIYKKIILLSLIDGSHWYNIADTVFHSYPFELFTYTTRTQSKGFFGKDVKGKFEAIAINLELKTGGGLMTEKDRDDQLALRIYRLVQHYIWKKTEDKSGQKYENFKNNKNPNGGVIYPREYREALEKICSDAFLAMRGRREQDFVEYFTGTICSVPHFLPEAEYLSVAKDLMENWQKIKTLSMLAISANSYLAE